MDKGILPYSAYLKRKLQVTSAAKDTQFLPKYTVLPVNDIKTTLLIPYVLLHCRAESLIFSPGFPWLLSATKAGLLYGAKLLGRSCQGDK